MQTFLNTLSKIGNHAKGTAEQWVRVILSEISYLVGLM